MVGHVYNEKELIIPALELIAESMDGLTTTELIKKLREKMKPSGDDLSILKGRNDDKFSQKVRNLISHKQLVQYVDEIKGRLVITEEGFQFLLDKKSEDDEYSANLEKNDDFREENNDCDLSNQKLELENMYLSVFDLKRRYDRALKGIEDNSLIMNPKYQRYDGIWSTKNKSLFIESIILNIPIPSLYLTEDEKGALIVIDGRQRLSTLFQFMDNKFKLTGLTILSKLNNKKFSQLTGDLSKYQSMIEDRTLHVAKLRYGTNETFIIETFERVNTKGAKLNAQEIRNAINQGKSTEMLNDISSLYVGEKCIIDKKRMKDKYLVLRYFAMQIFYNRLLRGEDVIFRSISDYLSNIMKEINGYKDVDIKEMEDSFIKIYDRAINVFNKNAFRLKKESPINMILFETTLILVHELYEFSDDVIKEAVVKLSLSDKNENSDEETPFQKNIKYHRDSKENIIERLNWIKYIVRGYYD